MVRDYQIVGDRVRYLSQERGEWEELPAALIDWDATRKWEKEHANLVEEDASPAMKEAEDLDKEESQERNEQSARMPPGRRRPRTSRSRWRVHPRYFSGHAGAGRAGLERSFDELEEPQGRRGAESVGHTESPPRVQGAHARVHLHVNDPVIYMSLGVEDETEPVLTHPITVDTSGSKAVNGKHGAHSPQSGFVIVRVDERQAVRIVGAIKVGPSGNVTQDEDTIPTKVEVMPGKHWLRVTPQQKLTIGEYALVEIISPSDINESVWDFRVGPDRGQSEIDWTDSKKQPRE